MRFVRLLVLTIVAVPAFAQQSWEGVWSGTTSQSGKTISITVNSSNRISIVSFSGMVTGTGCTANFDTTGNFSTGSTVGSTGSFTVNASSSIPGSVGFTMTGTLTTAGTGTGQVSFNLNGIPGVPSCPGTGTATLNVNRQGGPPVSTPTFTTAAILAVVGSVQGAAFFRTGVQIHNPRSTPISGKFVFHPQGTSGVSTDPSMTYTLQGGQTIDYADLLPAMGLSGLGSLDIMTTGDPAPIMVARVFSDAGDAGTAGFTIDPLVPAAALQAGDSGVIIVPSDLTKTRLNVGLRSLDAGASMLITLRSKAGTQKGTTTKAISANFFEQPSVAALLPGLTMEGSDTITFTINSGKAIIYAASTENKTQDPSLQYAKKTF